MNVFDKKIKQMFDNLLPQLFRLLISYFMITLKDQSNYLIMVSNREIFNFFFVHSSNQIKISQAFVVKVFFFNFLIWVYRYRTTINYNHSIHVKWVRSFFQCTLTFSLTPFNYIPLIHPIVLRIQITYTVCIS